MTTLVLILGLAIGAGTAGVLASSDGGDPKGADVAQYQPGKGCGDPNRPHTGPPGNPDNTECPPQSRTPDSEKPQSAKAKRRAACAKQHKNSAKKRRICVKRRTAMARCRTKEGDARKECLKRARQIGRPKPKP